MENFVAFTVMDAPLFRGCKAFIVDHEGPARPVWLVGWQKPRGCRRLIVVSFSDDLANPRLTAGTLFPWDDKLFEFFTGLTPHEAHKIANYVKAWTRTMMRGT